MAVGVMAEQRFIDVRSRRGSMDSLLSQQRIHPLTVEIEPSRGKREGLPTGLWLPSPVHSMLGPKKTLNLVGGAIAGQRRSRRPLRGPRRYSACTEEEMDSYPSLHPEEHCSLPSPTANISFLRLKSEANPKTVQGARNERTQLLISPEQRHTTSWRTGKVVGEHSPHQQLKPPLRLLSMYVDEEDEEDSIVSSDESDDEDDDSEDPVQQFKQPLLTLSVPPKSLPLASEMKCLLSNTSPLTSCNIKSLLSPSTFSSLPKLAQEQLVKLLPQADTLSAERNGRSLDFAIQNEYFSQALQRWQDTLALGLLCRKHKVPSLSQAQKWKEKYFEERYGDMTKHTLSSREQTPTVFYPASELSSYSIEQREALDAIVVPPDHEPLSPSLSTQLPSCKTISVSLPKKPQVKRVRNHQIKLPANDVCNAVPKSTTSLMNNHCLSRLARDLTVSVPVEQFHQVVTGKRILMEHSYSLPPQPVKQSSSLVLSVARRCSCSTAPLRVCLHCHGMFHAFCSKSQSHCPLCIARTNS